MSDLYFLEKPRLTEVECDNNFFYEFVYLTSTTKLRQGNVFTLVCQSFCLQGVSVPACLVIRFPEFT